MDTMDNGLLPTLVHLSLQLPIMSYMISKQPYHGLWGINGVKHATILGPI
jgi:hypothetical protein